jgi:hypothetical protein
VVREVNALRATLPPGLQRLEVQRGRTTEVAVMQVALTSDHLPMRRLEKQADRLRRQLDRVPGVRQATYHGAPSSEVRVAVDLARLAEQRLPVTLWRTRCGGGRGDAHRGGAGGRAPLQCQERGRFPVAGGGRDVPVFSSGGQSCAFGTWPP